MNKNFWVDNGWLNRKPNLFDNITPEQALDLAIEKWELLANQDNIVHRTGISSCALCSLYNNDDILYDVDNCKGCPVYEKTGKQYCYDTPYYNYEHATDDDIFDVDIVALRSAALAELEFLKALKNDEV